MLFDWKMDEKSVDDVLVIVYQAIEKIDLGDKVNALCVCEAHCFVIATVVASSCGTVVPLNVSVTSMISVECSIFWMRATKDNCVRCAIDETSR